ncbi:hypothetical protein FACS1894103_6740 [Campylobacterota bacterium]|nr:hypothetical protein FACS1894103_6740 [Campylobacterota bacterium]
MTGEYEIPRGSKLYFGKSAKAKREVENRAVEIFGKHGFEEISTPLFSYHQTPSNDLITFSDDTNNRVALRRDSALEVVRLILKRLGRTSDHRNYFYIQPVFAYPTREQNQIGAEAIGTEDLSVLIKICGEILGALGLKPVLQLGSIALLNDIQTLLGIDRSLLIKHEINKLLLRDEQWVKPLVELSAADELESLLAVVPTNLGQHLAGLKQIYDKSGYKNTVFSPLFYADMSYYDGYYFRFLLNGEQIAMGGVYESGDGRASGFAIYTDTVLRYAHI